MFSYLLKEEHMSKKFRKLFNIALSAVLAGIVGLSACTTGGGKDDNSDRGEFDPDAKIIVKDEYNGTHVFNAEDTDKDFVKNKMCDYKIVMPENPGAALNFARDELLTFFAEATGIKLQVVKETEGATVQGHYISIGDTAVLGASGITVDKNKLTKDGARIVTVGENIYIFGGSENGTLYGVYDFLGIYFNFDVYYEDCYEIDTNVKNLKLKNFDVTDIPDLEFRSNGFYRLVTGDWAYRFRVPQTYGDITFNVERQVPVLDKDGKPTGKYTVEKRGVHNCLCWLSEYEWGEQHPNWYNSAKNQLCYTAGGRTNPDGTRSDEYEAMLDAACAKAIETFKKYDKTNYPDLRILNFTQNDNYPPCYCDACIADQNKYGSFASSIIIFMNDLRTKIDAAMADPDFGDEYRRDDLTLTFFAYQATETAPDTSYSEMKLKDGVSVYLATSSSFDHQSSIYADSNEAGRENLKNWGKLSGEIFLWTYSTKFSHYMYPVETQNFYGEDAFTFFAANNVKLIYNQSQITQTGTCTAWHNLKAYLDSKLEWDGSRSQTYYTEKYMNAMFGPAAENMKEIYKSVRLRAGIVRSMYNGHTLLSGTTNLEDPDMWPYATVAQWLKDYDVAYAALEGIRNSDPVKYNLCKGHIDAEWLSPAYMMLVLYPDRLSPSELTELKTQFKAVANATGISHTDENSTNQMDAFLKSL